jgi:23S rRNA (guanosine2251-2'-O)-methyltransferase
MDKKEMVFGTRAVMEAIKAGREIEKIYIQAGLNNDLVRELINTAQTHKVPFSFIPQQKLNAISSKNHQGVICLLSIVLYAPLETIIDKCYEQGREPFFLVLDRITDVRNFGAIARTVECAGLDGIIIGEKGNAPISADAMKTSAGALNHLPVCRVKDMTKTFRLLKDNGIQVVACTEKANKTLYEMELSSPLAIVMGSEEDGISPEILKAADHLAKIPIHGQIGSLNVSVAAGVAIYEAVRQKGLVKK